MPTHPGNDLDRYDCLRERHEVTSRFHCTLNGCWSAATSPPVGVRFIEPSNLPPIFATMPRHKEYRRVAPASPGWNDICLRKWHDIGRCKHTMSWSILLLSLLTCVPGSSSIIPCDRAALVAPERCSGYPGFPRLHSLPITR